jgi:hypothetical protein
VVAGVLIAATAAMQQHEEDRKMRKSLDAFFTIETAFEFQNAETGVRIVNVGNEMGFQDRNKDPFAPRLQITTFAGTSGPLMEFRGFSGRPASITFKSDGFLPETYILTDTSPREVMVKFKPAR